MLPLFISECLPGYWGPECRLQCTDICDAQNSVGCNPQSGIPCQCKGGYEGITCSCKSILLYQICTTNMLTVIALSGTK